VSPRLHRCSQLTLTLRLRHLSRRTKSTRLRLKRLLWASPTRKKLRRNRNPKHGKCQLLDQLSRNARMEVQTPAADAGAAVAGGEEAERDRLERFRQMKPQESHSQKIVEQRRKRQLRPFPPPAHRGFQRAA
jgi:hypothetical protein